MISVIVPVYNAEKYLQDCVSSILSQTYKEYELLLIDDGSTDSTAVISKKLCLMDKRVKYYYKNNGGPSEARNFGVKNSKGEYITFVDADDFIDPRYLEVLKLTKDNTNSDISAVGLSLVNQVKIDKHLSGKTIVFDGKAAVKDMLYQKNLDTSPCALLVNREIIENNLFPVGKFHEDDFTVYRYFLSANNVSLFTGSLYFYIQRDTGIMKSVGKVSVDEIEASNHLVSTFENFDSSLYKAALSKKFSNFCQILLKSDKYIENDDVTYREVITFLKEVKWQILCDSECRLKNRIAALSLIFGKNGLIILDKIKKIVGSC